MMSLQWHVQQIGHALTGSLCAWVRASFSTMLLQVQ